MIYKLLFVDDHKIVTEAFSEVLQKEFNFEVDFAHTGVEALASFKQKQHQILVTNINMPEMDGIELTRKIKEISPNTKVIIFTMMNGFEFAVDALRAGADDYLLKGVGIDHFLKSLKRAINRITNEKFSFNIEIEEGLITSFQQYLLYFKKYITLSKNISLDFEVNAYQGKLEIKISVEPHVDIERIQNWLAEYLGFLGQNIEKLVVDFEYETSRHNADLLIADLKNEIAHLKNSLEIEKIRNNRIQADNDFFKTLCLQITGQPKNIETVKPDIAEELKGLIANGNSTEAIERILPIFRDNNEVYNRVIILNNQISQFQLEKRIGILERNTELSQMGRINMALLDVIDLIETELKNGPKDSSSS